MITLEIPAPEFVKRFQSGEIPASALVTVIYDEESAAQSPALALVEQWLAQTPDDAAQIEEAEKDLGEIQAALNATRQQAGARILYPESEIP